jgi:hypothetical protein
MSSHIFKNNTHWALLFGRSTLFFLVQCLFALGYGLAGASNAWDNSTAWWPLGVFIVNMVCLGVMLLQFRSEGQSYWKLFNIQRSTLKSDLWAMLVILIFIAPIAFLPNILLAIGLFNDPQKALTLLIHPLPLWAVYASVILFPITQGLVELPTYFAFIMPRMEAQGLPRWLALGLPTLMLGLQHVMLHFIFDLRYIIWRGLMFLPFALMMGILMRWRPRLLPYFVVIHILMDFSFAVMLFPAAY